MLLTGCPAARRRAQRRVATAPLEASDVFALPAIKMERLEEVGGTVDVLTRLPGRLTLLTLSFNEFARLQALRWSAPVVALAAARPGALQVLNLNVMDGWRFALLRYFLVRALRRATPPERLADTGVLFASNTEVRCAGGYSNCSCCCCCHGLHCASHGHAAIGAL